MKTLLSILLLLALLAAPACAQTVSHSHLNKAVLDLLTAPGGVLTYNGSAVGATLPSQTGNSGKFLTTNGSALSWGSAATLGANTFTALQTITQASANAGVLASSGYSLTGSNATNMIDLAGTWNTSGAPTAIKLNITNTASDAASLLMDLQVGGASKFHINKSGTITAGGGDNIDILNTVAGGSNGIRLYVQSAEVVFTDASSNPIWRANQNFFAVGPALEWSAPASGTYDTFMVRKAASQLQMGADANGTTAQMLTAANQITADGTGADLTIAAGNGRGGAAGNLIFKSWTTAGAATAGTSTTITTIDISGITIATAKVLSMASGSNQRAGNATLVGGTVTVSNTTVTANTVVMLTRKASGGTIGTAITYTLSAGASFTITSDLGTDTSTFSYFLIEVP